MDHLFRQYPHVHQQQAYVMLTGIHPSVDEVDERTNTD